MLRTRSLLGLATSLMLTTAGVAITAGPAHAADGTVKGTISAANRPVTAGQLRLERWTGTTWDTESTTFISRAAAKTYSLTVPPGTYRASFSGSAATEIVPPVLPTFFGGTTWTPPASSVAGTAGTFAVGDGGVVTKDIAYPAMREISGVLTSGGTTADSMGLVLHRWDAASSSFQPLSQVLADSKGRYFIPSAPEGTYAIQLYRQKPDGTSYEGKWVGNAAAPTTASAPGTFTVGAADQVRNYEWDGLSPAPTATTAPSIPATSKVGTALTVTTGTWTETPTFAYQWNRDGVAIPGATSATYTPVAADAGKALTVTVGATQALNKPGTATTNASEVDQLSATVSATKKVTKHKLKLAVDAAGVVATGKVKVFLGKKLVGKGTVSAGKATVKLAKAVKRGKTTLKVVYSGDTAVAGTTTKVRVKVIS